MTSDYPFGIFKLFTRSGRFDPQNKNKKCLNPKSERSCMCVRDIEFASLSTILLFGLRIAPTLCFFLCFMLLHFLLDLELFRQYSDILSITKTYLDRHLFPGFHRYHLHRQYHFHHGYLQYIQKNRCLLRISGWDNYM